MKRPAFQFYPADWRKDTALQACSIAARGVWHELICIMHECEPYGHLAANGEAIPDGKAARLIGATMAEYRKAMRELGDAKVYSRAADGVIYSRRMVKDEATRKARSEFGKLGGNPALIHSNKDKPPDKATHKINGSGEVGNEHKPFPTPSSSSSIALTPGFSNSEAARANPVDNPKPDGDKSPKDQPPRPARGAKDEQGIEALARYFGKWPLAGEAGRDWGAACDYVNRLRAEYFLKNQSWSPCHQLS